MKRTLLLLGIALLWTGCTESTTVLGPGEDTTQSLIINFGGTPPSLFPDSRSVFFVTNAWARKPVRAVTISDVRFSTIINEDTCEALAYTAVAVDDTALLRTANVPSESCSTTDRYLLNRRNAPFYGAVGFKASAPGVITSIDTELSLLPSNTITNVQSLQVIDTAQDLVLRFERPVDPVLSTLYLFEATLGDPEVLRIRFTEPDNQVVIPHDQLTRLRALSSGIAFTILFQEINVEEKVIPIRDSEDNVLTYIDVWNTNTYTVEVILP